jgi:Domain of unknown function (DUF4787)
MVSPKKATTPPTTSSSSYLLLAVKILLVIVIILLLPKLVTGATNRSNKRIVRKLEEMRLDCSHNACGELLPEESTMCVSHCISPTCHHRIYAPIPLEDGEIDVSRARQFEHCFREELRLERRRERSEKELN